MILAEISLHYIIVLILVGGWLFGRLAGAVTLPSVLGMLIWGVLCGTLLRDSIPPLLWELAPFLKSMALIVILLRAGLGIEMSALRKVGKIAVKMSFIPAFAEAAVLTLLFHFLVGFEWVTAALTAALLSAVSPAVVVPSMLNLKQGGFGRKNDVPTLILAGASMDDVIMISLFTMLLAVAKNTGSGWIDYLMMIPRSLLLGILPGLLAGFFLVWFFERFYKKIRATEKLLLLLGLSIVLVRTGELVQTAALSGIMTTGFILLTRAERTAKELADKLSKLWVFSEIILFVLIGMSVKIELVFQAGPLTLLIIFCGLVARSAAVLVAEAGSVLNRKEKLFSVLSYLPKATVQAALGAVPLQEGIAGGEYILACAVTAIAVTAPLGLAGIRFGGPRLLT